MTTTTLPAPSIRRPLLSGLAWGAMLLLSRLPQILLKQVFAIETSFAWISLAVALLLLVLSYVWSALQPLRGYLFVMAVVMLLTGPLDSLLRHSTPWTTWFGPERSWMIRFLGDRLPLLIEALLLMPVLVGMGMKRQEFFLAVGNLRAAVVGLRLPGVGKQWLLSGPLLALLLGLLFFLGTAALNDIGLVELSRVLPWLPAVLLCAAMNAFGEEFVYRAAPLSQLWSVVGETHAIWLTAVWFGLGHYYSGVSSGAFGGGVYAVMAGGIALLFGKAMLETRGIVLPTLMHMLVDVAIFLFFVPVATSA